MKYIYIYFFCSCCKYVKENIHEEEESSKTTGMCFKNLFIVRGNKNWIVVKTRQIYWSQPVIFKVGLSLVCLREGGGLTIFED